VDGGEGLRRQRWRRRGFGREPWAGPPARPLLLHGTSQGGDGSSPGARLPDVRDGLRSVWVVQRQHRSLMEQIGGPPTGGVVWIALDLGGPPHVAFGEQTDCAAAARHGRREKQRLARYHVLRRPDVRREIDRRGRT